MKLRISNYRVATFIFFLVKSISCDIFNRGARFNLMEGTYSYIKEGEKFIDYYYLLEF